MEGGRGRGREGQRVLFEEGGFPGNPLRWKWVDRHKQGATSVWMCEWEAEWKCQSHRCTTGPLHSSLFSETPYASPHSPVKTAPLWLLSLLLLHELAQCKWRAAQLVCTPHLTRGWPPFCGDSERGKEADMAADESHRDGRPSLNAWLLSLVVEFCFCLPLPPGGCLVWVEAGGVGRSIKIRFWINNIQTIYPALNAVF